MLWGSLVSAAEVTPVPPGLRGTGSLATTALSLQITPRCTLSLGDTQVVGHHGPLFPGWTQGQQPKVQSSSTVMSLTTAPMGLGSLRLFLLH